VTSIALEDARAAFADGLRRTAGLRSAALAGWLDRLDLAPGASFLHVGCGVGYYTAIAAEAVYPDGSVLGVEGDTALALTVGAFGPACAPGRPA
jgi:protein-L-isoaspartate O-methyltransferase